MREDLDFELTFHLTAADLRSYQLLLEGFLDEHLRRPPPYVQNAVAQGQAQLRQEAFKRWASEQADIVYKYRQTFRRSLIVLAVSEVEHDFQYLAWRLRRATKTALSISDLHGTVFERFRAYIKRHLHLPFPDDQAEWNELLAIQRVRNIIVHNAGWIDDSQQAQAVAKYSRRAPGLEIANGRLVIKDEFLQHALKTIVDFGRRLAQTLDLGAAEEGKPQP